MNGIADFFNIETLGTFVGAVTATLIITNTLSYIFNLNNRWVGLVVATALQLLVWVATSFGQWINLAVALINAFVVYSAAFVTTHLAKGSTTLVRYADGKRKFWVAW